MTLGERLNDDLKNAMKAQNADLLSTLRMIKSALLYQKISLGHELSDIEVLAILEKQAKQRRDSIEQYKAGGRVDLAAIEEAELVMIEAYLPKKLTTEALGKLVDEAIAETAATTISDMGKVMKLVTEKAAGAADGKQISDIVRGKLA